MKRHSIIGFTYEFSNIKMFYLLFQNFIISFDSKEETNSTRFIVEFHFKKFIIVIIMVITIMMKIRIPDYPKCYCVRTIDSEQYFVTLFNKESYKILVHVFLFLELRYSNIIDMILANHE